MKTWILGVVAIAAVALTGCDGGNGQCSKVGFCSTGYEWDSSLCACVPSAPACTQDSDCKLQVNNCDTCACLSLPNGTSLPACTGQTVTCAPDTCLGKTAACVSGTCRAQ
jgi:hypothetical protein